MKRQIVLTFDGGGLCNRIFPFANALAAAWEHDFQVVNPVFEKYRTYFRGSSNVSGMALSGRPSDSPLFGLPLWRSRFRIVRHLNPGAAVQGGESVAIDLDRLLSNHSVSGRLWVDGLYCLANSSFVKHSRRLRDFFRPSERIEDEVSACINQARQGIDVLVGVHIRQGDSQHHDNGMLYYETSEYVQLMRSVQRLFPAQQLRFLVCSNVPQAELIPDELNWRTGPGTEIGDLYALASCDYILGAPSSYTQWASFYGAVPRLVHNRKYESLRGGTTSSVTMNSFSVHQCGFGRFVVTSEPDGSAS